MNLQVGDITTVILKNSIFDEKQAEVVEIVDDNDKGGNIGVKFGKEGELLRSFHFSEDEKIIRFKEDELRKDDDWSLENRANDLFGSMWHTIYTLKNLFDPKKICKCCELKATTRILFNVWGSVYECDVCDAHRDEYHGWCGDELPGK